MDRVHPPLERIGVLRVRGGCRAARCGEENRGQTGQDEQPSSAPS
ncbi:hypothetical protein [Streptomyces sp. BE230]|nr:hypothetical protein [Streptomyces sp. BE230]